ncbi:hypothetical protein [Halpernia sp. GG3]
MKNKHILITTFLLITAISCKAQQTQSFKDNLKNNIEFKKNDYNGKSINNLLANISYPVKSYMGSSYTGKTDNIALYFITNFELKQRTTSPITLIVYFTEEKNMQTIDDMLKRNKLLWTDEEKAFFGNLIVKDVYVGRKSLNINRFGYFF